MVFARRRAVNFDWSKLLGICLFTIYRDSIMPFLRYTVAVHNSALLKFAIVCGLLYPCLRIALNCAAHWRAPLCVFARRYSLARVSRSFLSSAEGKTPAHYRLRESVSFIKLKSWRDKRKTRNKRSRRR